jgi:hypothetical protein
VIRHIVQWKLKPTDDRAAVVEEIRAALEPLVGVVPGLISLTVRPDVSGGDNWDAVLVSEHDSVDAVAAYMAHPAHVAAAAVPRSYAEQRAVVDYQV